MTDKLEGSRAWGEILETAGRISGKSSPRWGALSPMLAEAAGRILEIAGIEQKAGPDYFRRGLEELQADNDSLFGLLEGDGYALGWMNPSNTVPVLGEVPGQLLAAWRMNIETCCHLAFRHDRSLMSLVFRVLPALEGCGGADEAVDVLRTFMVDAISGIRRTSISEQLDPSFRFFGDTVPAAAADGDPRHLFRYGRRIRPEDIRMAAHVNGLPAEEAALIAGRIVESYELGFSTEGKDLSAKGTASLMFPAGFERIAALVGGELESRSISPVFTRVSTQPVNRQADYDHKFDWSLYISPEAVERLVSESRSAYEALGPLPSRYSGVISVSTFGNEPFSPVPSPHAARPGPESDALYRELTTRIMKLSEEFMPRAGWSFTAAAFPSPAIRGDFPSIFEDTVRMNTLDNSEYAVIQKALIDVLDTASSVRVRGAAGNRTDLEVRLHALSDPATQTNFQNCLATVNIPLGEVYTSPVLEGTAGVLHVEEAFISGLKYIDLEIVFANGLVTGYGCGNFPDPEQGRKYVYDNLLHPYETLPMGEFAIGTNTFAYSMARRHGIMDLMPVLILEKMGPHIAIGDTCFSWEEDHPVHNVLDGKEVIARENERTCLRREDPSRAYTHRHADITLPYSSLDSISAVGPDGRETLLISGGRFVLPGTERLNEPLD